LSDWRNRGAAAVLKGRLVELASPRWGGDVGVSTEAASGAGAAEPGSWVSKVVRRLTRAWQPLLTSTVTTGSSSTASVLTCTRCSSVRGPGTTCQRTA